MDGAAAGTAKVRGSRLLAALRLCRIEYVGFGYLALLGALVESERLLDAHLLLALLATNVLFVAWTFADNDVCDVEVDRAAQGLEQRVLVSGQLSIATARTIVAVLALAMITISALALPLGTTLALGIASLLAFAYDRVSKRWLGSDALFGLSAAALAASGAIAVRGDLELSDDSWRLVIVVCLEMCFFNAVSGGLKDLATDRRTGARTLAQTGVTAGLRVKPWFVAFAFALKILSAALASILVIGRGGPFAIVVVAIGTLSALLATGALLRSRAFDFKTIGRQLMVIEFGSRTFVLAAACGGDLPCFFALFVIPAVWYLAVARWLHGRGFALPDTF
jgi:4-hydroxybenzoate polyprenyltransferase